MTITSLHPMCTVRCLSVSLLFPPQLNTMLSRPRVAPGAIWYLDHTHRGYGRAEMHRLCNYQAGRFSCLPLKWTGRNDRQLTILKIIRGCCTVSSTALILTTAVTLGVNDKRFAATYNSTYLFNPNK